MNRVFKSLLIVWLLVTLATIVSCTKTCDTGYEGKRCDMEIREKFEGVWNALDNPGNLAYVDTISKGTGILDVLILRRFASDTFDRAIKATISANTINIANQRPDTSRIYIEGTGTISDDHNTINWNYNLINKYDTNEVTTSYTGVWTR